MEQMKTWNEKTLEMLDLYQANLDSDKSQKQLGLRIDARFNRLNPYSVTPQEYYCRAQDLGVFAGSRRLLLDVRYHTLKLPMLTGWKIRSEMNTLDYIIRHSESAQKRAQEEYGHQYHKPL